MAKKRRRKKARKGEMTARDEPVWEPLLGLARIYIDEFMWMFEVKVETGARLQAYKHYWTRRYLYLDEEGEPWVWNGDGMYEPYVGELLDLFNRVVLWHYPGQHARECEEWLERHREGAVENGIPGYTPAHGEGDGLDA